jgi:non-heme chloroperoxidase
MPYFNAVDGSRLFYSAWGNGRPIIFVHGGNASADIWEFQVPSLVEKGYEPFRKGMLSDRAQLFRESMDAFFCPSTAEHPVSDGIKDWMMRIALGSSLMPMLELFRATNETDFRQDMKAFALPTLIIHGDSDVFAPPASTATRTHEMISGSKLLVYRGASHGLFFTHHGRLTQDVAQFLAQTSA